MRSLFVFLVLMMGCQTNDQLVDLDDIGYVVKTLKFDNDVEHCFLRLEICRVATPDLRSDCWTKHEQCVIAAHRYYKSVTRSGR